MNNDPKTGKTPPTISDNPKVAALLFLARAFTERDYADLALAAVDQAGIPADVQDGIRSFIDAGLAIAEARRDRLVAEANAARHRAVADDLEAQREPDEGAIVEDLRNVGAL